MLVKRESMSRLPIINSEYSSTIFSYYKFQCGLCNESYYGECARHLNIEMVIIFLYHHFRDFIQNEVKQIINLHNQEEYQTVVDKKLITNLEGEIEFLKSENSTKKEIIKKLLDNDIRQNKSCNMVGKTWDFEVTHESGSESMHSASNSEDSLIESRDVNTINTEISNMSIDDQLKMIREEKHQEYLLNTGCKSLSSENTKNNKNTKQFSDQQAKKENINEAEETNKEFHWPSGTCAIVGDSMVNGIDEKRLQKHGNVKVFYFSGARINDMNHHLMPIITKRPDYLILHVGTMMPQLTHPEKS